MANSGAERGQPVLLQPAENLGDERVLERPRRRPAPAPLPLVVAAIVGIFWLGGAAAYAFGLMGPSGLAALAPQQMVVILAAALVPPVLLLLSAWAFLRGEIIRRTAADLAEVADRLFTADETAARTAARLARAVRRELDALNAGLEGAGGRLHTLETTLQTQIAALDEAGARIEQRVAAVGAQLGQERQRLDSTAAWLTDTATRASEDVASQAARLTTMIETAQMGLGTASQTLDAEAGKLRAAIAAATEAPQLVAGELDRQAKRIEAVSDAAMARAEFVLGRHERHRAALQDMLGRLKEESSGLEQRLSEQRQGLGDAVRALKAEAVDFTALTAQAQRDLEQLMADGHTQASGLTAAYVRETERLKETADLASGALSRVVEALKEAGAGTQALIGDTANEARLSAKALVSEAMGESQRLVQLAAALAQQAAEVKEALGGGVAELERHLIALPGLAQQEAARVRAVVASETDELLDVSARMMSVIHARAAQRVRPAAPGPGPGETEPEEGLRGLARKLTQRPKRKDNGRWEMSQLLAAVDSGEETRVLKPGAAAALGALQAALADLAVDLDDLLGEDGASQEDWRHYVRGDRSVFARRLAQSIDGESIARIAALYRDNSRFREAANTYLSEFEALLLRARDGDGDGLLTSTLLSADTGKIYLSVAYALGRLS